MQKKFFLHLLSSVAAFLVLADAANAEWLIRERIINIDYQNPSADASNPSVVDVDHSAVPELDVSYFLDKPFSLELSGTASRQGTTSALTSAGLGDVWVVPATLTAQYHFFADQPLQFYIGAGVNYTWFFTSGSANGHNVTYDNSVGPVGQIGADLQLTKSWLINLDVKKIYMRPEISIDGSNKQEDKLDPWIVGAGVGYRF